MKCGKKLDLDRKKGADCVAGILKKASKSVYGGIIAYTATGMANKIMPGIWVCRGLFSRIGNSINLGMFNILQIFNLVGGVSQSRNSALTGM